MKYSFIVPVYNTEKYLKKCLDSLVNQTYDKFEIIIVNDGSLDNSKRIINDYKKKYKNIIVVNQENQGLSMARNNGVKKASGDYLIFVDSDDYVEKDLLKVINKNIKKEDVLRFQVIEESKKSIKWEEQEFDDLNGVDAFKILSTYHFVEPAWCYVIKTSYYNKNKFSFKKNMFHEDYGLIPLVIYKANRVKSINYLGYHYIIRDNSIMTSNDYKKTFKKANDTFFQYLELRKHTNIKRVNNDDYYLSYITNSVISKANTLNKNDKKRYIKMIKEEHVIDGVLVNTFSRKIKKLLMKINLGLYLKYMK